VSIKRLWQPSIVLTHFSRSYCYRVWPAIGIASSCRQSVTLCTVVLRVRVQG